MGDKNGKLVFWRGASYLPYWQTKEGKKEFFEELLPRSGNSDVDLMPDKVNTYSHVKIIENTSDSVLIHWRYLRSFKSGNPDIDVVPEGFVDEYFTIKPNGEVNRTVRPGQAKSDDWNNPGNLISQTIQLSKTDYTTLKVTDFLASDIKTNLDATLMEGRGEQEVDQALYGDWDHAKGTIAGASFSAIISSVISILGGVCAFQLKRRSIAVAGCVMGLMSPILIIAGAIETFQIATALIFLAAFIPMILLTVAGPVFHKSVIISSNTT